MEYKKIKTDEGGGCIEVCVHVCMKVFFKNLELK